ncbi:hypothetical protein KSX_87270 [Ktedonospora formicarum]|uniref:DUF4097 domain-containing protein n=2 Tax=Ktedonospora formicarum TaxID=2778364 RepID=A0A8J3I6P6_9CHLR|nr:hypothetical protein KSX_87270 [Ktedonospora formicarum]
MSLPTGEKIQPIEALPRQQSLPGRKHHQAWHWLLVLILALAGILCAIRFFPTTDTRAFSATAHPHIKLYTSTGNVQIAVHNAATTEAKITKQMVGLTQEVKYQQNGDTVEIDIDSHAPFLVGSAPVVMELALPASTQLEVATKDGNIEIAGTQRNTALRQLNIQTHAGSVRVKHMSLADHMRLRTDNGNVAIDDMTGSIDAQTKSGAVTVEHSRLSRSSLLLTTGGNVEMKQTVLAEKVEARSNTGSIFFQGMLEVGGMYDFKTNAGHIDLRLSKNGTYHFATLTGTVKNEFTHDTTGNSPKATVNASTQAGLIVIKKD